MLAFKTIACPSKENATLKEKAAAAAAGDVFKDVKEANGVRYIASQVEVSDAGALRTLLTNGNKQTTQMFLSLRLTSEKKLMSL